MAEEADNEAMVSKSKQLVRSHALCGDDDTKLSVRAITKQASSKSSDASSLSRDSSNELYTDPTSGMNLEEFIMATLHKNERDREQLLTLEAGLIDFIRSPEKLYRFHPMSSYNRMLVHRVAAFFGLDHNVDQTGGSVVVTKSKAYRMPETRFKDYIKDNNFAEAEPKKSLRRDVQSCEEVPLDLLADIRKVHSFDEREPSSGHLRPRNVMNQESSSSAEGMLDSPARPWSSTESSSESGVQQNALYQHRRRYNGPMMQKACSYGGSSAYYQHRPETPVKISVQGYPDILPPTQVPMMDLQPQAPYVPSQPVIFAVASLAQVPPGAMIIHPTTGQPCLNSDGSIYRHDPISAMAAAGRVPPMAYASSGPVTGGVVPAVTPDVAALAGQLQQMSFAADVPLQPHGGALTATPQPVFYNGAAWHNVPPYYSYMVPTSSNGDNAESGLRAAAEFIAPNPVYMQNTPIQYASQQAYNNHPAYHHQQHQMNPLDYGHSFENAAPPSASPSLSTSNSTPYPAHSATPPFNVSLSGSYCCSK